MTKGLQSKAIRRKATLKTGTVGECLDAINDFVQALDHYPPLMVATAMRAHLEVQLRALLECDICTLPEVRQFIQELEREVLEAQ